MGPRRVGPRRVGPRRVGPEGWGPEGWGPEGWAAGARTRQPKNSKRAHLRAPAFKTPPKFNEKTPRETQKERNGGGKGKKKREILGGPAEGVQWRGGPAEGGPGKSKPATTTTTTTTTTTSPEQVGPRRAGPSRVCRGWAQQNNTTTTTTTTKIGQNTKTLKLAKVGLAKVGQHSKTKSVWP